MTMKLLVIGNGMMGHKLLEELMERQPPGLEITVLCEENRPAYDRVDLSEFFSGKRAEDLSLVKPGFFDQPGIQLRLAVRAAHIDRQQKRVTTADGEVLTYDKVVCYGFQAVRSADYGQRALRLFRVSHHRRSSRHAGMGYALQDGRSDRWWLAWFGMCKGTARFWLGNARGRICTRLMAVQVDDVGGQMLRRKIEQLGVTVHTCKSTQEIVDTDMIVFSAGVRPRDELARQCELGVDERGGIHVDNYSRTLDLDIYAIGECVYWGGKTFAPGYDMARVVAAHLCALLDRVPP